ncbi:serine hydrolase [Dietzia sp. SLG310A2-38A2]|nr:serine hydrolase [Dietzia sp. SLG310A2-38A2]
MTTVTEAPVQGGTENTDAEPNQQQSTAEVSAASRDGFDRIVASLPAGVGVAVAPVGGSQITLVGGDLNPNVAWSTIKVPLALAARRESSGVDDAVERALTVSDNTAAEVLWAALGGGGQASAAVESVLTEAGDFETTVPSEHRRPGFSIFGQTEWSLEAQAAFGAGLACLTDGSAVLGPMTRVDPAQSWGLGRIPGAAFKGGWGPTADGGGYLVRQFGIVPTPQGRLAVAVAAYGRTRDDGAALLSRTAESVSAELGALSAGECS